MEVIVTSYVENVNQELSVKMILATVHKDVKTIGVIIDVIVKHPLLINHTDKFRYSYHEHDM